LPIVFGNWRLSSGHRYLSDELVAPQASLATVSSIFTTENKHNLIDKSIKYVYNAIIAVKKQKIKQK